jgi:hypothetical protein
MSFESPEHQGREQSPFLFFNADTSKQYSLPANVASFLRSLANAAGGWTLYVCEYIDRVVEMAKRQQGKESTVRYTIVGPLQEDGSTLEPSTPDDVIDISSLQEQIAQSYEGKLGWYNLREKRRNIVSTLGKDFLAELDQILGVDTAGLQAGDEKPFLGVNTDLANAMSIYADILFHKKRR